MNRPNQRIVRSNAIEARAAHLGRTAVGAALNVNPTYAPETVGFVLAPQFSLLAFSCAIEPLGAARSIRDPVDYSLVLVRASFRPESLYNTQLVARLRNRDRAGVPLGAIDTGAFVLVYCGLLNGYRASTHWESIECFRSEFSRVTAAPELYVIDRSRLTCAGGNRRADRSWTQC